MSTRYPEYKDSGIEWLGEIPIGWEVSRLNRVSKVNPSTKNTLTAESQVAFLPMESIHEDGTFTEQVRIAKDVQSGYTSFQENDLLIAKVTPCFENGKAVIAKSITSGYGYGTTELHVLRASEDRISTEFLYYATRCSAFTSAGVSSMKGVGGLQRVSTEAIANFILPIPPIPVQHRIVEFLDAETARIDTNVSELEALVTLLTERRKALISETVTRGLPGEHPEFKDSGVEWLGEIPVGWEYAKLGNLVDCYSGGTPDSNNSAFWSDYHEGTPWVAIGDMSGGRRAVSHTKKYVSHAGIHNKGLRVVNPGAVLFAMYASVGEVSKLSIPSTINQAILALTKKHPGTSLDFLAYSLIAIRPWLANLYRSSTQNNLNASQVKNLRMPFPELEEQHRIVEFLDRETSRIDALASEAKDAIALLKEKRKVLISDVVTGKIMV